MIKIGLLGLGNKSEATLRFMKKSKIFDLTGIYDQDTSRISKIAEQLKLNFTANPFGLIMQSDLLIIPKDDEKSYNLIVESILNSKHVVIENPLALTLKELDDLLKLSSEASVSVIPFLPIRFNNSLINAKPYVSNPSYIQITYSIASKSEFSLIEKSEKLINLIDMIIYLVRANIKNLQANSIKVTGNSSQLFACRFEFDNGCIANLMMDFISNKDELQITAYQSGQIVNIDLIKNNSFVKTFDAVNTMKYKITKPESTEKENIYESIVGYLNTVEKCQTQISLIESFKNSLTTLKKVEDKLA
jgi:Oxidoreductase family, NAD-binding Rossmann fold